jgi:hypothetical protein
MPIGMTTPGRPQASTARAGTMPSGTWYGRVLAQQAHSRWYKLRGGDVALVIDAMYGGS